MNAIVKTNKKTIIPPTKSKEEKIHYTFDYSLFTFIPGNRKISKKHIVSLTNAIAKEDKSSKNPIIVNHTNGKFGIVEGQHRFIVWRDNKMPVYYLIDEEATIETVRMLNIKRMNWQSMDYLESYAALGNEHYRKLLYYVTEYKISVTNARIFFADSTDYAHFRAGEMTIPDETRGMELLQAYLDMKEYVSKETFWDRDFVRALIQTLGKVSLKDLIEKFKMSGWKLERQPDKIGYLRAIEDVLKFRMRKNITRLY